MSPPHRLRRLLPALLVAVLLPVVGTASAPPVSASSTYHCTGYTACANAGMSDAGYAAVNKTMYWRMYAGHNCTNYVAYRMIKAGMSTARPWAGSGMAYNWGFAMKSITDTTPRVGAVAWWNRGVAGAGSSGHVAYVEKVVSSTEIVISEDSWNGDFHWRTIVNTGAGWPTGFIHFVDKSITGVTPAVVGTPQVGQTLTASGWAFVPGSRSKQFQWLANGVAIAGATAKTLVVGPAQQGATLAVRITATRPGYSPAVVVSAATAAVAPGVLVNTVKPVVAGSPEVDQVLTATPGVWSPAPETSAIRWRANGTVIAGATASTLTLTKALVGKTITATEIAIRAGYAKSTVTTPTAVGPVLSGVVEETTPFAAAGRNRFGQQLSVVPGRLAPTDAVVAYTWFRDGVAIPGAAAASYAPTKTDIGHALALRVSATRPSYRSFARTFSFGTTTTPSATVIRATSTRKKRVVVGVRVRATGLGRIDGPITLTIGKYRVSGRTVNGFVRLVVDGLAPGTRRAVVTYGGTGAIEPSRAVATVQVKG